uniref:Liocalin-type prostaglandin D synthase-like protein n=1 Tax=Cynops pyrrhogaster TaxID=8330 RepID=B6ZIT1_CYNPY|nr:liocalin-type prostaglandin D synthase-like protein [Cynops pyrrhogaster]
MFVLWVSLGLALTSLLQVEAMDVPVVKDFETDKFLGRWYSVVVASNCTQFMKMKSMLKMPVNVITAHENGDLDVRMGFPGKDGCMKKDMYYQMISPGRYTQSTATQTEVRIVETDYKHTAIEYSRKVSELEVVSVMVKLYAREADVHPGVFTLFKMLMEGLGLTEENMVVLPHDVECVPGTF